MTEDKTSFDQATPPPPPYQKARRKRIALHSTLRANHDYQMKKQTTEQHSLVQPSIQQKRQH